MFTFKVIHNETGHYVTELYTEEAVSIIKNHDIRQPLFLYLSHQAVHSGNADDPLQVPNSYLKGVRHIRNHKRRLYAGMYYVIKVQVHTYKISIKKYTLARAIMLKNKAKFSTVANMKKPLNLKVHSKV